MVYMKILASEEDGVPDIHQGKSNVPKSHLKKNYTSNWSLIINILPSMS